MTGPFAPPPPCPRERGVRKGPAFFLLAALLLALATAMGAEEAGFLPIDDFEKGLKPGWTEKSFVGHTGYEVVALPEGGHALRAESRASASGLVYEIEFDPAAHPLLVWRWKVENLVTASDPTKKATDDYPARVYVVFPHWWPPSTRSLNYIWATGMERESFVPNPFFKNAVMIAVESGPEKVGEWVEERRDIAADFERVFGEKPPKAGAVALMTDTDNTGESATAWYDDIRLLAAPAAPPRP